MRLTQNEYKVVPLPDYKSEKIRMLTDDFKIPMSAEEKAYLNELPDEVSVDRFAREMFNRLH